MARGQAEHHERRVIQTAAPVADGLLDFLREDVFGASHEGSRQELVGNGVRGKPLRLHLLFVQGKAGPFGVPHQLRCGIAKTLEERLPRRFHQFLVRGQQHFGFVPLAAPGEGGLHVSVVLGVGRGRDVGKPGIGHGGRLLGGHRHEDAVGADLVRLGVRGEGDQLLREVERVLVRQAVRHRKRGVVGHAAAVEALDRQRPRLQAELRVVRQILQERLPRLARRERAVLADDVPFRLVDRGKLREADDQVFEAFDELLLAQAGRHLDRRTVVRHRELRGREDVLARPVVARRQQRLELRLRHRENLGAVVVGHEVGGVRHDLREAGDVLVHVDRAPVARERLVDGVALRRARGLRLRIDERLRPDDVLQIPVRAPGLVDRMGVAVEDLADLLAGERHDAAEAQGPVRRAGRREAELLADAVDLLLPDAVLRERLDERLLDRDHLGVGDLLVVLRRAVDVVVHLRELGFARELHLAGVVLAGRDVLELLEGDVDFGEVDGGHGGFPVTSDG